MEVEKHSKQGNQSEIGWSREDKARIACIVFPLIELYKAKAYSREFDAKLALEAWEAKLSHRFTADAVLYALDVYTDKKDDFPFPSSIISILEPEPPRITTAQYIQAQRDQERNGYPIFSDAKEIIDAYENQERQDRKNHQMRQDNLNTLSSGQRRLEKHQIIFDKKNA